MLALWIPVPRDVAVPASLRSAFLCPHWDFHINSEWWLGTEGPDNPLHRSGFLCTLKVSDNIRTQAKAYAPKKEPSKSRHGYIAILQQIEHDL